MADEPGSVQALIERGLAEIGRPHPPRAPRTLRDLAVLVAAWGGRMNLTGHRDAEAIARRLILDAAALLDALPDATRIVDLGSGAGFPGLPFAILSPSTEVVLVESRERRHHFQRQAIRELGIGNARAVRGRFDELEPDLAPLVVAQAVSAPSGPLEGMLRWCEGGGTLAIPTAASETDPPGNPRIRRTKVLEYRVPLGGPERGLWIAELL